MQKHIYTSALILAMAIFPAMSAQAQDMDGDSSIHPYAGMGLGAFGLEYNDTSTSVKKTAFGGYGKLGADIGDYFGAEVRIGATGSVSQTVPATTITLQVPTFFSYFGKLQFPVTSDFKVYALAGATTAQFKGTNTAGFNRTETKTGFSYGAGVDYSLQDTISAGVEWVQYWNDVDLPSTWGTNAKAKIWGIVLTGEYHF